MAVDDTQLLAQATKHFQNVNSPNGVIPLPDEAARSAAENLLSTPEGAAFVRAIGNALQAHAVNESLPIAKSVDGTRGGAGALSSHGPASISLFQNSAPATGSIASLVFWSQITNDCTSLNKHFIGTGWGLSLPGAGFLPGTLYYDQASDLQGSCWAFVAGAGPWISFTYCHDQDLSTAFATFQAANIGLPAGGGAWIQGTWS